VLAALKDKPIRFAVLPDHPVPIKLRAHTTTPVPVAVMGPGVAADEITCFSESTAPNGKLGAMKQDQLMKLLLNL
jgi:2,3-bisphosphoglycerate-independent phosphoglycerate mutase